MNLTRTIKSVLHEQLPSLVQAFQTWPWLDTVRTLRARFRDDRLGLTASSLTFTTLISLVPLLTVMLAVFSAFPMFSSFQVALQKYFLQSLARRIGWARSASRSCSSRRLR
jgi:membrane protein